MIFEILSIFKAGIFVSPHIGKNHWLLCHSVEKKIIKYSFTWKINHHLAFFCITKLEAGLTQNLRTVYFTVLACNDLKCYHMNLIIENTDINIRTIFKKCYFIHNLITSCLEKLSNGIIHFMHHEISRDFLVAFYVSFFDKKS